MKVSGPTIMSSFSATRPVFTASPDESPEHKGQIGVAAVQVVVWSEKHGDKEILKSELWKLVAANMWLAT